VSPARLPLDDIRVLDLTVARSGPTCVRHLADWGAEVIRVEPPEKGGTERSPEVARQSADFADVQNLHRNKRSIALNLKSAEGRELFNRMVAGADVLVENMRPAVKYRLGVDYERVSAINPRLVYGSISGFGQEGPYADRGGLDQIAQGLGGLMTVTGHPGGGPLRAGIPIADLAAGMQLALGILVALHERDRSGAGQWVQTSLLEAMIAMLDFQAARWTIDGEVALQEGNNHPIYIPMGCFATADGYVNLGGSSGRLWRRCCEVLGLPQLPADPRFDSAGKRSAARNELNAIIQERLRAKTTAEWVELLNDAGVPAGPVNSIDQVFADPQVKFLEMVASVQHASHGELGVIRNATSMSRTPSSVRRPAPEVGEHTTDVLVELGLTDADIAGLCERGVVAGAGPR
jgi:formyl-CoA transferase